MPLLLFLIVKVLVPYATAAGGKTRGDCITGKKAAKAPNKEKGKKDPPRAAKSRVFRGKTRKNEKIFS